MNDRLTIRTLVDTETTLTGVVIPAGTTGNVLEYDWPNRRVVIDFGLTTVVILSTDCPLIELAEPLGEVRS